MKYDKETQAIRIKPSMSAVLLASAGVLAGCGSPGSEVGQDNEEYVLGTWSAPQSTLASGAFTTGSDLNLPVCRARWDNGWQPGKYWHSQCLFEFGGQGLAAGPNVPGRAANEPTFETLIGNTRMSWVPISKLGCGGTCWQATGTFPLNAIDGGPSGTSSGNQPLPVCAVLVNSQMHPGKYWANGCNIEYGGQGYHLALGTYYITIAVQN